MCKQCTAAVEELEAVVVKVMETEDLISLRRKSKIVKGVLSSSMYNIFFYGLVQATLLLEQDEYDELKPASDSQEAGLIQQMKQVGFDIDSYRKGIQEISTVLSKPLNLLLMFGFIKLVNLADPNRHSNEPSQWVFGTGENPLA